MPIESGGDNLAATFSPELADLTIYVIDVAAGGKIRSKGGPGITRSDLLVINKVDLAPFVGASLEVMQRDAKKMRGVRPFVMTNLRVGDGVTESRVSLKRRAVWQRIELVLIPSAARQKLERVVTLRRVHLITREDCRIVLAHGSR